MRKTQAGQRSDTVADKSSLALFDLVPCCDSQASSDRSGPIRAEAFCASKVLSSCKNFAGKGPCQQFISSTATVGRLPARPFRWVNGGNSAICSKLNNHLLKGTGVTGRFLAR
jgi:hypothetical protein